MEKRSGIITITILTLGLCLVTTAAFAADYQLINSAGTTLQAKCASDSSYTDIANGATADFSCTGDSLHVRVAGGSDPDSVSFQCRSGNAVELTVNMGSAGELTYSTMCS